MTMTTAENIAATDTLLTDGAVSPPHDQLLTFAEVCKLCKVGRTTLWHWQNDYGLRVICIGGVKRVRLSDLQSFLQRHESGRP
jgi:hypothetical protein